MTPRDVFVTGGTGFIGRHTIPKLLARGHRVRALTRHPSLTRVAAGAEAVLGNALDTESITAALRPGDTVVHLVGTAHPNPIKAREFEEVDLASIRATVAAAKRVDISHLVYVSVAQPAPLMRAYAWVRALGETMIREAGLTATILRPFYVLGPGRRWPMVLLPLYRLAELFPAAHETAERLGLVPMNQMANALVQAVEASPMPGMIRVWDVAAIRSRGQ